MNKELNKQRILNEIELNIEIFKNNPDLFVNYSEDKLRDNLIKKAKENNYRGTIKIRKSHNDPKSRFANMNFIVYIPKNSLLQNLGQIVAHER